MIGFKRGATFTTIYEADAVMVDGVLIFDLTGWTARCVLRRINGQLIEELIATIIDPVARLIRLSSTGTAAWPKGRALGDIHLSGPGGVPRVVTETFSFAIIDGPT